MNKPVAPDEEPSLDEYGETLVVDEAGNDDTVVPLRYEITSFGADYDVEGLVRRLNKGEIKIPDFQRSFIWTQTQGSRYVETLL